jgi:hypothetical protein
MSPVCVAIAERGVEGDQANLRHESVDFLHIHALRSRSERSGKGGESIEVQARRCVFSYNPWIPAEIPARYRRRMVLAQLKALKAVTKCEVRERKKRR